MWPWRRTRAGKKLASAVRFRAGGCERFAQQFAHKLTAATTRMWLDPARKHSTVGPMNLNVGKAVATLRRVSVDELRAKYAELFGEEAWTTNNRVWLVKRRWPAPSWLTSCAGARSRLGH